MVQANPNSLVHNIASQTAHDSSNKLPTILDDTFLLAQLEQLSLLVTDKKNIEDVEVVKTKIPTSNDQLTATNSFSIYEEYIAKLDKNIEESEVVLQKTQSVSNQLSASINEFNTISNDTNKFIELTNELYNDYIETSKINELIPKYLQYFEPLDTIMRRLNYASSASIIRKDSFKTLLGTIENSLIFLEKHKDFREGESYRIKFKQSLIRSSELTANYLNNNIMKNLVNEVNERMKKINLSDSSSIGSRDALLYNKFESVADDYQQQLTQITKNINNPMLKRYHDELNSVLLDCLNNYFSVRETLMTPILNARILEIENSDNGSNIVNFIQNNKSYFQQVCLDEYRLFTKFFPIHPCKDSFEKWILKFCNPLYYSCNNKILRETDICLLCDSVTLFSYYFEFDEGSEEYLRQYREVKFDKVFEPILQKLQQRLILRVQQYIDYNIVNYKPTIDSFIIGNRKTTSSKSKDLDCENDSIINSYLKNSDGESYMNFMTDENFNTTSTTLSDEIEDEGILNPKDNIINTEDDRLAFISSYYPPLIKASLLLSKIYDLMNSVVFDDLAHHIVHDCIISLKNAYHIVINSYVINGSNVLDIDLAYMKNLLLLRNQIEHFNIEYTVPETYLDFSAIESFFLSIRKGAKYESSVLELAKELVPKVVNNMVDARYELIQELRNNIKNFTEVASKDIISDCFDISGQDKSKNLITKNIELRNNIEAKLPRIHLQILNFITDKEVVGHLISAIQEVIVQSYSNYFKKVIENIDANLIDKDQISELMDVDVFTDFVENVCNKVINIP